MQQQIGGMKRVGVARTQTGHEYGIYCMDEAYGRKIDPPAYYTRYEGRRYNTPKGEVWEGLPGAGPNAAHMQPICPLIKANFEHINWFKKENT